MHSAPPVPKPTATTPETSVAGGEVSTAARMSFCQPAMENRPWLRADSPGS